MQLRPYQRDTVDAVHADLAEHGSTLAVAPTGAGKTVMIAAIVAEHGGRALIVQHREELLTQNRATFCAYTHTAPSEHGEYSAHRKTWRTVTFGMIATLARAKALPSVDLVVIDEAHRARAASYVDTIDRLREANPDLRVLGVTATPARGDKKGLGKVFASVAHVIGLGELIDDGHLVTPECHAVDVGLDLASGPLTSTGEYDLRPVSDAVTVVVDEVLRHWVRLAGQRPTVFFCPSVETSRLYADRLQMLGYVARHVDGETPPADRRRTFADLRAGRAQVLCNVFVATEGWDCPPVSCVVLLRPSSFKSTMIQMIGRGLRAHEGKTDCIVLDFGRTLAQHGDLIVDPLMEDRPPGDAPKKLCPSCESQVPAQVKLCPICGFDFIDEANRNAKKAEELARVELRRMEMIARVRDRIVADATPVWTEINADTHVTSLGPITQTGGGGVLVCRHAGCYHVISQVARDVSHRGTHSTAADAHIAVVHLIAALLESGVVSFDWVRQMRAWHKADRLASAKMIAQLYPHGDAPLSTPTMHDAWSQIWFKRSRDRLATTLRTHSVQHTHEVTA